MGGAPTLCATWTELKIVLGFKFSVQGGVMGGDALTKDLPRL